ncbi:MAG: hypothetical protein JXB04_13210 [Kiritimatiellae bacterium]|nr:hypothetical protein [Kiritimatiellia bacterium]
MKGDVVLMAVAAGMLACPVARAQKGGGFEPPVATMPFVLYNDCESGLDMPYIPAGWMGDTEAIDRDDCWKTNPHSGTTCIRNKYIASGNWAGIVWQSPPGDWGEEPGGYDLSAAKKLTFWARGEKGGEEVEFKFGILDRKKEYPDSTQGRGKKIKLKPEWQKYEISISGNKKCIKTGFVWTVEAGHEDLTFFLDDIQYE